jgi:hypothetical protein
MHNPHRTCRNSAAASNLNVQKYSCPARVDAELGSLGADDGQKGPFSCCSLHQTRWLMKAGGFAMVGILGLGDA